MWDRNTATTGVGGQRTTTVWQVRRTVVYPHRGERTVQGTSQRPCNMQQRSTDSCLRLGFGIQLITLLAVGISGPWLRSPSLPHASEAIRAGSRHQPAAQPLWCPIPLWCLTPVLWHMPVAHTLPTSSYPYLPSALLFPQRPTMQQSQCGIPCRGVPRLAQSFNTPVPIQ